jgi:hypothetical protein
MAPKRNVRALLEQADLMRFLSLLDACCIPLIESMRISAEEFPTYALELEYACNALGGASDVDDLFEEPDDSESSADDSQCEPELVLAPAFLAYKESFHPKVLKFVQRGEETGHLDRYFREASDLLIRESGIDPQLSYLSAPAECRFYHALARGFCNGLEPAKAVGYASYVGFPPKDIVDTIAADVEMGNPLARILGDYPEYFPNFVVQCVLAIEAIGSPPTLEMIADLPDFLRTPDMLAARPVWHQMTPKLDEYMLLRNVLRRIYEKDVKND